MWKILRTRVVLDHPRQTLLEDEVELPDGSITTYLKAPGGGRCVTVIARRDDGRILVQTEYAHPLGQRIFQFPGGGVEKGEDLVAAANRELMEESKLRASTLVELGSYVMNNRRSDARMSVFVGTGLVDAPLPGDPTEQIESFWFEEREIDDMIRSGTIVNSTVLAGWMLYRLQSRS